jgi:hypothetical protein
MAKNDAAGQVALQLQLAARCSWRQRARWGRCGCVMPAPHHSHNTTRNIFAPVSIMYKPGSSKRTRARPTPNYRKMNNPASAGVPPIKTNGKPALTRQHTPRPCDARGVGGARGGHNQRPSDAGWAGGGQTLMRGEQRDAGGAHTPRPSAAGAG